MRIVIGSAVLFLGMLVSGVSRATDLDSTPPGVHVRVSGRVGLAGTTPLPLDDLPPGDYRLEAQGRGTALARGRLVRESNGFAIHPSASASALFLPPGILHLRQHETGRGLFLLGGGLTAGTMTVVNEASRSDAVNDVERAQQIYDEAVTEDAILAARLDVDHARDEANDEAEMRNLWALYGGAIWVGAAAEQWLLTPHATLDKGGRAMHVPRAGGAATGFRSLLVPGSGQRYLGRATSGNLFMVGVMGLGAGTLIAHESYLSARRDQADAQRRYEAAASEEELERWRAELENAAGEADSRNTLQWAFVGITAGVYLWNFVDAWFVGEQVGSGAPVGMSLLPAPDGFQATLTWRTN